MEATILAYDFGTGGTKASLYDAAGQCLASDFASYETYYPQDGWHEQRPEDWWQSVIDSTRRLFEQSSEDPGKVRAIGISGHSLGLVPMDEDGQLLRDQVPIWSDSRPDTQMDSFFKHISEEDWYQLTGNGFPPALYTVFKMMWLRDHEPETFEHIHQVIGTKDYVNYKMTGVMATDYSYASGSGVYDLKAWNYSDTLINASGLPAGIFPKIVPSTEILGTLTAEAAEALGLPESVQVVAGGVDNSCMALGALAYKEGACYNSMGSSSWIAVSSSKPLVDLSTRPYVFTHVVPGMFNSATAIFSAGSSFRWMREQVCTNLDQEGKNTYEAMIELAESSAPGANGVSFVPHLAGGSSLDETPDVRGAFLNINLGTTQADLIRATMEGICFGLKQALDALQSITPISDSILAVGGGSRSDFWVQMYADIYGKTITRTNVDQQAAALGAAALAAVGCGIWEDFSTLDSVHQVTDQQQPSEKQNFIGAYSRFLQASHVCCAFANHEND
ncbi:pentose kinase [Verrucomicrobiaceae bacterium N1E253]|uniref:Pentose kinase n=1 Tax=Oceaniferula marina TaxID=2748318 RepID=A0A851GI61_9BACT|nr:FGGY-family carbohydrate kinase [Oceaniferula marina]NWK56602.1 pentose kinase [Oceaniferula marina]